MVGMRQRGLVQLKCCMGERKRGDGGMVCKGEEHHLSCGSATGKMTTWESFTLPVSLQSPVVGLSLHSAPRPFEPTLYAHE